MWRVLLHNDDYTTQEFVVWVLESVFHKPRDEAFAIMMSVHRSGMGVAGVYTHDVAETKLKATRQLAEDHEFPLLVTMEPEPAHESEHACSVRPGDAGDHPARLPARHRPPPRHRRPRASPAGDCRRAAGAPHPVDLCGADLDGLRKQVAEVLDARVHAGAVVDLGRAGADARLRARRSSRRGCTRRSRACGTSTAAACSSSCCRKKRATRPTSCERRASTG